MKTKNWLFSDYSCLTMAEGLLSAKVENTHVVYDMFFREIPNNGGFAVMAGLSVLIEELKNLKFSEDILSSLEQDGFSENLINYLRNFKFSCDVYAVPEGTPIFPNEPIVKVCGPVIQVQLIETLVLNIINHQTLIAESKPCERLAPISITLLPCAALTTLFAFVAISV